MASIVDQAKNFLATEQGQNAAAKIKSATGVDVKHYTNQSSAYEGFGSNDSTSTGGFGLNAGGSAFSRAMGTADTASSDADTDSASGTKTGASTPGYRRDGDDGQDINTNGQFRGQNLSFTSVAKADEPEI